MTVNGNFCALQLMAEEQGLEVSIDGFNKCMDQQRERSRVSLESATQIPFSDCLPHELQNAMDSPGSSTLRPTLFMAPNRKAKQYAIWFLSRDPTPQMPC